MSYDYLRDFLVGECGYLYPRRIPNDHYACVSPFLFTYGIITGPIGDMAGYEERWCYHSLEEAVSALEETDWDAGGRPTGWIRHIPSHR